MVTNKMAQTQVEKQLLIDLKPLDEALRSASSNYAAMIASGSTVTGDPWVEGLSDRDILLAFRTDFDDELESLSKLFRQQTVLNDSFSFVPTTYENFVRPGAVVFAFGNRFRCKTLFGVDFVNQVELPTRKEALMAARAAIIEPIMGSIVRLERKQLDSGFWSQSKVQREHYAMFKTAFVYLAVRNYGITGIHPTSRKELADALDNSAIWQTYNVMSAITVKSIDEITLSAKELALYLKKLEW